MFHNEFKGAPVAIRRPRATCGLDGWGSTLAGGASGAQRVPRWPPSVCTACNGRCKGGVAGYRNAVGKCLSF